MPSRLHVLAPKGRDLKVILETLTASGIPAERLADVTHWEEVVEDPRAGGLLIADEALPAIDMPSLVRALATQPAWSDMPIIILTRRGHPLRPDVPLADLQNVILLERPLHSEALVKAARAGLRARVRQRKTRDYLVELEEAKTRIASFAEALEQRVAQAVAARLTADEQRRESEERYRYTIELSGQIPFRTDKFGRLNSLGDRWFEVTDFDKEEEGGLDGDWHRALHPEDVSRAIGAWAAASLTQSRFAVDLRLKFRDGYRFCEVRAAPRMVPHSDEVHWYGTIEDIHDRYIAQQELRQTQAELVHVSRLSAMGTMAATLAHELNQPLTAIANYLRGALRLLAKEPATDDRLTFALVEAERGAIRAGEVVERLRELVARGKVRRKQERLAVLVHEAARIALVDAVQLGISCAFEIDERIVVLADRIQLQQVVINLLRNAIDAVQGTGDKQILVIGEVQGDLCRVTVNDSGPGVSPLLKDKLFTPFSTTKETGLGIGLSISRTIVEANGGQLVLAAGRLKGAAFQFTVPLCATTPLV